MALVDAGAPCNHHPFWEHHSNSTQAPNLSSTVTPIHYWSVQNKYIDLSSTHILFRPPEGSSAFKGVAGGRRYADCLGFLGVHAGGDRHRLHCTLIVRPPKSTVTVWKAMSASLPRQLFVSFGPTFFVINFPSCFLLKALAWLQHHIQLW